MAFQDKKFRIVTLSRFDYQKNMDFAYQIASHWSKSDNVEFVWVGDGDDRMRLENKANQDNVPIRCVGFSTEPIQHLSNSDIYLSTSRFEGLPYALIEAISVGLPVIATDVKGNNEVVKHGYNGFLFNEEEEAVKYINMFINNLIDYSLFSTNSVKFFEDNFTEEEMINKTSNLYSSLLS